LTEEALHSKARLEIVDQEHAEAKAAVIQQYEEHKAIISEQLEAAKAHYEGSLDALKQERDALQLKVTETVLEAKVADVKLEEAYKTISRLQAEVIEVKSELRELRTPAAAQPQQKKKVEQQNRKLATYFLLSSSSKSTRLQRINSPLNLISCT
jgi:chromosome segregation ATPase